MNDEKFLKSAVDLIVLINTAVNNVRFYPPGSELIATAVGRIDAFLPGLWKSTEAVEYGEFERTLMFQGEPLSEKDQKKPPVNAFLKLMLEWKIRSIAFQKGVTKREIASFVMIVAGASGEAKPVEVRDQGALARLVDQEKITHIKIDKKIYMERDADQSIVAGFSIKDEDIAKYILGDQPLTPEMLEGLRSLAKDSEWLARVFKSGVSQLMTAAGGHSSDLSGVFARMTASFESISEYEKSELAEYLLSAATDMDDDAFLTILTQDLSAVFGDNFLNVLVEKADDALFEKFVGRVQHLTETAPKTSRGKGPRIVTNRQLAALVKSVKSVQAMAASQGDGGARADAPEKLRAGRLAAALGGIVKCPSVVFHERVMLDRMEETVKNLLANRKFETIATLFGQLGNLLQNREPDIRTSAASLLANIDEQFETAGCFTERIALSRHLVEWMRIETEFSKVYEKILERLQGLVPLLAEKKQFRDAEPVLNVEFSIAGGTVSKNADIRAQAVKFLKNLATEEMLNRYLQEMHPGGALPGEEDIRGLVILGSVNVDRLLDLLHDSHNRSERNCIVRVVSRIGTPAAGPIIERIQRGGPWFYVRNMALLLGRIGDESHLKILESLLKDKNTRIQREGILAIQNIGGTAAAKLLYQNLHAVDDELKGLIISFIGNLKYRAPVADMIGMLESGALGRSKKDKIDIMVKICEAFGRMGDEKAVPVLKRIAEPKGFLAKTYDSALRVAAEEALKQIEMASAVSK